jgi:type IV secretion system protein VirB10
MSENQATNSLNAGSGATIAEPVDIVSVNKKGSSDNKAAKAISMLVLGAVLVGALTWFAQRYATQKKEQLKQTSGSRSQIDTAPIFNPEKTGASSKLIKLGSDGAVLSSAQKAASAPSATLSNTATAEIRPMRGADGQPMVNSQGRVMGADGRGNVVEVPPIALVGGETDKRPLPGQATTQNTQRVSNNPTQVQPSNRYGGSLFVGDAAKSTNTQSAPPGSSTANSVADQLSQVEQVMKQLGLGSPGQNSANRPAVTPPSPTNFPTPFFGQPPGATLNTPTEQPRPGTVGSSLYGSTTPVAVAKRFPDQNLVLPKGRQADCVLTSRIVDDVPGFTSCVLANNLYGDNGRVLLLERGSELTGEYGITNQMGSERLFVTWLRLKTPEGVEIDLSSPGSDRLGTSGVPGHLDNRWGARIGSAFLISFVKDVTVAIINNQTSKNSGGGATVNVGGGNTGQSTINAGSSIAEEVIKQTLKVRPRLTINEGDRISVYVARDLDFTPVYELRASAPTGFAGRPLAK